MLKLERLLTDEVEFNLSSIQTQSSNTDQMNNEDFSEATQSLLYLSIRDKALEKFTDREKHSKTDNIVQDPTEYNHDFILQHRNGLDSTSDSDDSDSDDITNDDEDVVMFYDIVDISCKRG